MNFEELIRFSQVMPGADAELDLRVLKAHLLAEEALNAYLEFKLPRGQLLSEGRLSFSVKNRIAKSASVPSELDWVWDAYSKLNTLRNSFAHQIDDGGRNKKMDNFILSCQANWQWSDLSEKHSDHLMLGIFMSCLDLGRQVQAIQDLMIHPPK